MKLLAHRNGAEVRARHMACLGLAVLVVLAIYPDVAFLRSSLYSSRILGQFESDWTQQTLLPEPDIRRVEHGFMDPGGTAWHLEPAQYFMRNALRDHESIFWNPYAGAGTYGPETLADAKCSVFTWPAALGMSPATSYDYVLLTALACALFFLLLCLHRCFGLSIGASLLACFTFALGGFLASTMNNALAQPYLLSPMLLYALLRWWERPTVFRFTLSALAHAVFLSATFVPTMALLLACTHLVAVAHGIGHQAGLRTRLRLIVLQVLSTAVAMLLMAPLYFPIFASFSHTTMFSLYGGRQYTYASSPWFLSLFTPKHFWESYTAFSRTQMAFYADYPVTLKHVYHLGIAAMLIACHACATPKSARNPIVLSCLFLLVFSVARIFDLLPMQFTDLLPVVRSFGYAYWGAVPAFALPILAAFGYDALSKRTAGSWPALAFYVILGGTAIYLFSRIGLPEDPTTRFNLLVLILVPVLFALLLVLVRTGRVPSARPLLALLAVLELTFYMNHLRPLRGDIPDPLPPTERFVQHGLGQNRIFATWGAGLFPNWAGAFKIAQVGNAGTSALPWYEDFVQRNSNPDQKFNGVSSGRRWFSPSDQALDFLSVQYIVIPKAGDPAERNYFETQGYPIAYEGTNDFVFENTDPAPRVRIVHKVIPSDLAPFELTPDAAHSVCTTDAALLDLAEKSGLLQTGPSAPGRPAPAEETARITAYHNAQVTIEASLSSPGVLVLNDAWHPNWTATLNGEEAHVARVNSAFRGIFLTAGDHEIILRYRPGGLSLGIAASSCILALLAVSNAWAWRRRATRTGAAKSAGEPHIDG